MKTAVIVFPGSNRDRDMFHALDTVPYTHPPLPTNREVDTSALPPTST